ncbi:hypothetical protein BVE84_05615 [Streptococcus azizii]|uniref:Phage protein n=1 Tax=Streptococcus azizii TaxID=1579424 RepID=A0AB36JKY8_9STRE|nr:MULTISPECIES: hypothetical protein [Streptococcus]QBX22520.1 hypothetical protein Javan85_0023 [Streptococcus phage Javan85]QBX31914.1 hypothetical protein Javan84_0037 [Streptococcus phage Javan84]MBF0775983.1 hypothetical protein [Streptococcus sp. 19428wD3_AN2]MBF0788004.1 hypothetical protein [Streptococcus sp. 19428wC2_LYSM12]ONK26319.1 hypothetical protein BVE86_07555 [Streptococcus azizii]
MTQQYNQPEREFGWDDTIQQDAKDFILLPPGDYQFTVTGFERGRHTPNPQNPGKLPECNKAIITVLVETEQGDAIMTHNLFLHSSTEGMLSAFFGAIGQKKHGEPLRMNWNTVVGSKGVCRVKHREYNDEKYNDIKSMIYADKVDWSKVLNAGQPAQQVTAPQTYQTPQPSYPQQPMQQQPQQPAQGNFTGF